jgi:ribonucleoside-diphosphate reductase beta chain
MSILNKKIFNTEKTDYATPALFFGQDPGLADTVNKRYPEIWDLYKKLKSLDWDELAFDFAPCNVEFKTCPQATRDIMIRVLAWQWETDTAISRALIPVVAPFVTSTELWTAWSYVAANENLHALTYSEIVRTSFDDPSKVIDEILSVREAYARLKCVTDVMGKVYTTSHLLALDMVERDQDTYNDIFMFVAAMYILERVQFMASFSVTFAIADSGLFVPIGTAVQKICQDEFEVHVELNRAVLNVERETAFGCIAFQQCKPMIEKLLNEVVQSEFDWLDNLFSEGRELAGYTAEYGKRFVLWSAKSVYEFFDIKPPYEMPQKNPAGYMDQWMRIDAIQASPQENRSGSYMVGSVVSDHKDKVYDIDL